MIDSRLFETLFDIFPDAFNATRSYTEYSYASTEYGIEVRELGTGTENLADNILHTAQAMRKGDINRGLNYLRTFKKKSVQRQELKSFNR